MNWYAGHGRVKRALRFEIGVEDTSYTVSHPNQPYSVASRVRGWTFEIMFIQWYAYVEVYW